MGERRNAMKLAVAMLTVCVGCGTAQAETCTTQSAMTPAERSSLADAARSLALKVQSDDVTALRVVLTPELSKDAAAFEYLVGNTSTKLAGGPPVVEESYTLDATNLKKNPDGSAPDAQFFCSLNNTTAEVQFTIPALPPGKYGFAIVTFAPA